MPDYEKFIGVNCILAANISSIAEEAKPSVEQRLQRGELVQAVCECCEEPCLVTEQSMRAVKMLNQPVPPICNLCVEEIKKLSPEAEKQAEVTPRALHFARIVASVPSGARLN